MRKLLNICLLVYLLALPAMAGAQNDSVLLGVGAPLRPADSSALVSPLHSAKKTILPDSLHHTPDSLLAIADTLSSIADTLDSLSLSSSLPPLLPSPNALTAIVHYKATDSIAIDINKRKAQLFSKGSIEYDGMELKADDIRVDFDKQILSARPVTDTAGKVNGRPFFKQGEDEYMADTIVFNYNTHKGLISGVITQQGDGFLHGSRVKRVNDSVMYLNGGQYTTCNYAHPHFAINFTHSKLITGDKIFTGPAYVTIEDVPTPLVLPFAFFPMNHKRTSGILMPSYGWMNNRGYYLKDGGYYFALGDHLDLALIGELYTNLSWAAEARSNYYVRYKYKGNLDIRYGITKEGIPGDSNTFRKYSDFKIAWKHDQDNKANPRSRFSANVNLQSRNYNKNTTNRNDYFN
ncbi:MAG: putative LPS assembly protein LptD, partial [Bacteroidales bacterium]|nr:putative LPS assembly protein LptD [Bacteroidales bacterium]